MGGSLILAEDDHRLYLSKPAGIPVFPPHADPAGDCLLARLLLQRPDRAPGVWPRGFEGGIAHRLDTLTSGLVIAARTPEDLAALRDEFAAHTLRKFYLFRSDSRVVATELLCEGPLAHHPKRKDRMVVHRRGHTPHRGRWYPAWTRFVFRGEGWWQAEIRTGVMHQIRAHARDAGIPLRGDPIYADPTDSAPGAFTLHHACIVARAWRSPVAPLPGGPDVLVRP